jgi:acyl carrier protein
MQVTNTVIQIIAQQIGSPFKTISTSDRFATDLKMDSLDKVEVVMAVEDEFAIMLHDEDADKCYSVQDLCLLVRRTLDDSKD